MRARGQIPPEARQVGTVPPPPFSLRQRLEWRKAAPSPAPNVGPGEGRSRRLARPGLTEKEACSRAVSGAGWALNAEDSI